MRISRHGIVLVLLMILAGFVFTLGITWGLPSRKDDRYLLGEDYHGLYLEQFTSQVPEVDSARGADVVAPMGNSNEIVHLNDTDEKRARILCRYRLYSYQPDEMITFRALSLMKPGSLQFDPRLYQYGGLWIYPVGGLIEAGHLLGLVDIADRSTYIDNPELFGKFYIVARGYSAAWGVVGVWAVYMIVRRMSRATMVIPVAAAICFLSMPVVINAAHEAKPHLAGTVLVLLAALAADNWVQTGKLRSAWLTGAFCGAAAGMVLWGVVALFIIPTMCALRRDRIRVRLQANLYSLIAMIGVYAATNPYVIYHLLHDPDVLKSNLGNTAAMYRYNLTPAALWNAIQLFRIGTGTVLFLVGSWAILGLGILSFRQGVQAIGVILAVVGGVAAIQFFATAAGKPGEYARFAILPDILISVAAICFSSRRRLAPLVLLGLIAVPTIAAGGFYVMVYSQEAWDPQWTTRRIAAERLERLLNSKLEEYRISRDQGNLVRDRPVLGVYTEPAPYCLPPVDLVGWDIIRLPRSFDALKGPPIADVIVRPKQTIFDTYPNRTPISWADIEFEVTLR